MLYLEMPQVEQGWPEAYTTIPSTLGADRRARVENGELLVEDARSLFAWDQVDEQWIQCKKSVRPLRVV